MRVVHDNIDDLLADLRAEASAIYQKVVRVQIHRLDEFSGERHKAGTSFIMGLCVTALVRHDDGDWCIEFAEACGRDDLGHPDGGTDVMLDWRTRVQKLCHELGLKVRPGKIEVI